MHHLKDLDSVTHLRANLDCLRAFKIANKITDFEYKILLMDRMKLENSIPI